jgi:serine protease Do
MGSGFIISRDGYLITNHHVVDGADQITVRLSDKREFPAQVIGGDPHSDVALLEIDAAGLPTATIGRPDQLKVGQWVFAITIGPATRPSWWRIPLRRECPWRATRRAAR